MIFSFQFLCPFKSFWFHFWGQYIFFYFSRAKQLISNLWFNASLFGSKTGSIEILHLTIRISNGFNVNFGPVRFNSLFCTLILASWIKFIRNWTELSRILFLEFYCILTGNWEVKNKNIHILMIIFCRLSPSDFWSLK